VHLKRKGNGKISSRITDFRLKGRTVKKPKLQGMDCEMEGKLWLQNQNQISNYMTLHAWVEHQLSQSYIQYLLMQLKIKNPIAVKTEDERIRSNRTFLTTVCDHQVYCNSSHTFLLSASKHDAQDPSITSANAAHVMKWQTFMQTLYKTLWMLPFGLWLPCILLGWFCTQICPRP
jgi:hypothetical protein